MLVYNVSYDSPGDEMAFIASFATQELADKFVHGMMNVSEDYHEVSKIIGIESKKLVNREVINDDSRVAAIIYQALVERQNVNDPEANAAWYEHVLSKTREQLIPDDIFRFGLAFGRIAEHLGLTHVEVPLLYHEGDRYDVTPVEVATILPEYLIGVVK